MKEKPIIEQVCSSEGNKTYKNGKLVFSDIAAKENTVTKKNRNSKK